jgi:hypothetical protein
MKAARLLLLAALCGPAAAQTPLPPEPEAPLKPAPDPGTRAPGGDQSVVVPPSTGNEEIVKKPKNVDPRIDDATGDIDRNNRKRSEEKSGKQ